MEIELLCIGKTDKTFWSEALKDYEKRINALGVKGSFRYLEANWIFDEYDDGTLVSVNLELDLNNIILEKAIDSASGVLIKETISSFEKRLLSTS